MCDRVPDVIKCRCEVVFIEGSLYNRWWMHSQWKNVFTKIFDEFWQRSMKSRGSKASRCIWFDNESFNGGLEFEIKVNNWRVFQISGFQNSIYIQNIIFRWVGQGESPNYTSPKNFHETATHERCREGSVRFWIGKVWYFNLNWIFLLTLTRCNTLLEVRTLALMY